MEPIETPNTGGLVLPAALYHKLKWFVMIVLPAFGTAYLGMDAAIGLPAEDKVVAATSVLATFIGTIVGISTRAYNRSEDRYFGEVVVQKTDEGTIIDHMTFTNRPEVQISDKSEIALKVRELR